MYRMNRIPNRFIKGFTNGNCKFSWTPLKIGWVTYWRFGRESFVLRVECKWNENKMRFVSYTRAFSLFFLSLTQHNTPACLKAFMKSCNLFFACSKAARVFLGVFVFLLCNVVLEKDIRHFPCDWWCQPIWRNMSLSLPCFLIDKNYW